MTNEASPNYLNILDCTNIPIETQNLALSIHEPFNISIPSGSNRLSPSVENIPIETSNTSTNKNLSHGRASSNLNIQSETIRLSLSNFKNIETPNETNIENFNNNYIPLNINIPLEPEVNISNNDYLREFIALSPISSFGSISSESDESETESEIESENNDRESEFGPFENEPNTENECIEDVDFNFFENSTPIHPSLNCSRSEVLMMVMMFYLKHNLSWIALTDLLALINNIFGSNILPQSKYLFRKAFPTTMKPKYHFYCQSCSLFIENLQCITCPNCDTHLNFDSSKNNNFFISLPIVPQIKEILKTNIEHILPQSSTQNRPPDFISDIFDGELYKNLNQNTDSHNLITLTINTDGVKIFKSAKKGSFWPLQFVINELDPKVRFRSENIIVCGFWFGSDPIMEVFLKPFIDEIVSTSRNILSLPFETGDFKFTLSAIILTLDTIAKDKLQKKKQFNGYMGCSYCLHPGCLVSGHQVRYCKVSEEIPLRNHKDSIEHMKEAFATKTIVNGFKSISPAVGLPCFNVIDGFCIDYMHCCLLGVVRQMLELWFDSENHSKKYYIGLRTSKIDEILCNIKPPQSIHRKPRSTTEKATWKANEFRNWVLYFSLPCLRNILDKKHYEHYALLPQSLHILLSKDIARRDIAIVRQNLSRFVDEFEILYGPINMTYNVHLLNHLTKCVENCGPLWTHSNFCFENNNGILSKYVKGTRDVGKQISSKYIFHKIIQGVSNRLPHVVLNYQLHLQKKHTHNSQVEKLSGKIKDHNLDETETIMLRENNISMTTMDSYGRFCTNNYVYCTRDYCKKTKFDNSTVYLNDDSFASIKYIFLNNNQPLFYGEKLSFNSFDYVSKLCNKLKCVSKTIPEEIKIFDVRQIKNVCVNIKANDFLYVSQFPNQIEMD